MSSSVFGWHYPPGFDGYLPGERTSTDAVCDICEQDFYYSLGRTDRPVCDLCWDDEISLAQGE